MEMLTCLFCRKNFSLDIFSPFCPVCREPLFVLPLRKEEGRPIRHNHSFPLEKYASFLPLEEIDASLSLGEGGTPLLPLAKLGGRMNIPLLYAKNEAQNPTGSFKDRGTVLAVQKALSLGFGSIGTVSTGNMAASTAAYGAKAGIETFVLLKEGTSKTSLESAGIYGPSLITVQGDYGELFFRSMEIGKEMGIYFMNSSDPFRIEGYKVTAYEIFDQLDGQAPDYVFVPVSAGGHLLGLMRAFEDLEEEGLIAKYPVFVGIQAEGCAPLVRAYEADQLRYERLKKTWTIAHAISNPAPPAGNAVLRMIHDHQGVLLSVSDEEMLAAQKMLATDEGLFCQPESAATLAGLIRLVSSKAFEQRDSVVLVLTGSGLKTPHILESFPLKTSQVSLEGLEERIKNLDGIKE